MSSPFQTLSPRGVEVPLFDRFLPGRDPESRDWTRSEPRVIFDHPYIRVEEITYGTPSRETPAHWVVARRHSAVTVAPRLADGRMLLVRQERYPVERTPWEFPAGLIDDHANREDAGVIASAALREMREETGHMLGPEGQLKPLGFVFTSPGFSDEHVYLFLADGVIPHPGGALPDGDENILECRAFHGEEIRAEIAANRICDAHTLALYARLCALGWIG